MLPSTDGKDVSLETLNQVFLGFIEPHVPWHFINYGESKAAGEMPIAQL